MSRKKRGSYKEFMQNRKVWFLSRRKWGTTGAYEYVREDCETIFDTVPESKSDGYTKVGVREHFERTRKAIIPFTVRS